MNDNLEDDDLEWEEWNPTRISFIHHMIAGSAAGLAEHVSVFPIDTLKTHIQCERCGSMSPMQTWNCATRIVGREGIFRLWRGVTATFAGCLPGFFLHLNFAWQQCLPNQFLVMVLINAIMKY
jgi:solute carrier family 25 (mitochondrial iron transporter), member 28/37